MVIVSAFLVGAVVLVWCLSDVAYDLLSTNGWQAPHWCDHTIPMCAHSMSTSVCVLNCTQVCTSCCASQALKKELQ